MRDHLLARRARAQNQSGVRPQAAENTLGQFDTGESHGHRTRADLRFSANALADFERALEHTVEYRPRAAMIHRDSVSVAYLAENLGFAKHHGIQAGGHAEEMPHRVAAVPAIEATVQPGRLDFMEGRQEKLHGSGAVF